MSVLKNGEDDESIIVSFQIPNFAEIVEINFDLEKKTIEKKDDGLIFLFKLQKKNINIINEIKKECENNPNDPIAKEILKLLPTF